MTHYDVDAANTGQLRVLARAAKIKGRSKMKRPELRAALRALLPPRESEPVTLFVELCAGTAAVSLRLQAEDAKPPVSRMGSKTGYATAVLHALDLHPGQKALRFLWCEPDAGCRLLYEAYRDPAVARAAATIIRGWKDEDPRALWDRLKAEGPFTAPAPAREIARWCLIRGWCIKGTDDYFRGPHGVSSGKHSRGALTVAGLSTRLASLSPAVPGDVEVTAVDPREVARWCLDVAWSIGNDAGNGGFKNPYGGLSGGGTVDCLTIAGLSTRLEDLPPAVPGDVEVAAVDPREIARWVIIKRWTFSQAKTGYGGPGSKAGMMDPAARDRTLGCEKTAARVTDLPPADADVEVAAFPPAWLPPGVFVYIDPPYVGTTSYKDSISRERIVELARAWYEAGATVAISEQDPIFALVDEGWRVEDITGKRAGQKRTFSKQKTEYLTLSPEPPC